MESFRRVDALTVNILKKQKVMITGASGFVGRAAFHYLTDLGYSIIPTSRAQHSDPALAASFVTGDINRLINWSPVLRDVDVVIHLAAKAHVLDDQSPDALAMYKAANTAPTIELAEQAIAAGVKRFIFISSIGVNGAETFGIPFKNSDLPAPHSPYAVSKQEAEHGLNKLFKNIDNELVILRPPLIYGRGAPGNFSLISKYVRKNIPLPLLGVSNKRSFIALDNFLSLLETCISHPEASNKTFLLSDGFDLTTTEFVNIVGKLIGIKPRLFKFPKQGSNFLFKCFGRKTAYQSLFGDLEIDSGDIFRDLELALPFNPISFLQA